MKRFRQICVIFIILISIVGCSKIKGNKYAKEFVKELEFKSPYFMSDDFFISKNSRYYDDYCIYHDGRVLVYASTKDEFLETYNKYQFEEAEIKNIDINDDTMFFTFYASIRCPENPLITNYLNGRRKIEVSAKYGKKGWKLSVMAIIGVGNLKD